MTCPTAAIVPPGPSSAEGPDSDDAGAKLYGSRLGHFAAFGRPEWRMWDWLWGRLDAAAQIGTALGLQPSRIKAIQTEIVIAEGHTVDWLAEELPRVMALTQSDIENNLRTKPVKGRHVAADVAANVLSLLEGAPRDGVPAAVTAVGQALSATLADHPHDPPRSWHRVLRGVTGCWLRRPLWRWLDGGRESWLIKWIGDRVRKRAADQDPEASTPE